MILGERDLPLRLLPGNSLVYSPDSNVGHPSRILGFQPPCEPGLVPDHQRFRLLRDSSCGQPASFLIPELQELIKYSSVASFDIPIPTHKLHNLQLRATFDRSNLPFALPERWTDSIPPLRAPAQFRAIPVAEPPSNRKAQNDFAIHNHLNGLTPFLQRHTI